MKRSNPAFTLSYVTHYQGAHVIAAGAKLMHSHYAHPVILSADLDDLRRAHAAIGDALAEYDRAVAAASDRRAA